MPRGRALRLVVIIVMSGLALVRPATASADPIVVIVMENQPYATIVGSQQAPFINTVMIARGTLATNYVANINGSLRNYFAMTSGITNNKTAPASENLFHQLQQRGISWAEYEESSPSPCFKGGQSGTVPGGSDPLYTVQHDPAGEIHQHPEQRRRLSSACAAVHPLRPRQHAAVLVRRSEPVQRHAQPVRRIERRAG